MRWFYELAWLWKGLGISLLAAAACMVCVWLVCRATGKRLRTGIAVWPLLRALRPPLW